MIIDASTTKNQGLKKKKISRWQEAANDARAKIARLEKAAKYYLEMHEKGEPWPGERQVNEGGADVTR